MNCLAFINSLRPSLPVVQQAKDKPFAQPSNSQVRRWIEEKAVVINAEHCTWSEEIDFPVISVVLFPKSTKRVTLL